MLKDKSGVGTIYDKIYIVYYHIIISYTAIQWCITYSLCDYLFQISDLSEMTSYRSNENEAAPLLSRLFIDASLFIVSSCKEMVTKRLVWPKLSEHLSCITTLLENVLFVLLGQGIF